MKKQKKKLSFLLFPFFFFAVFCKEDLSATCLFSCFRKSAKVVHFAKEDQVFELVEVLPSYLDFYRDFVEEHGLKEGWLEPESLEGDCALEELDELISLVKDREIHECLSLAESLAYICAFNIRLGNVTYPLNQKNLLVLRRSYSSKRSFQAREY